MHARRVASRHDDLFASVSRVGRGFFSSRPSDPQVVLADSKKKVDGSRKQEEKKTSTEKERSRRDSTGAEVGCGGVVSLPAWNERPRQIATRRPRQCSFTSHTWSGSGRSWKSKHDGGK